MSSLSVGCAHHSIDIQDNLSYTPSTKKEALIKIKQIGDIYYGGI